VIVATDQGSVSQLAVRQPPWKLIHRLDSGEDEGYHLDVDPRELHNRSQDVPQELRKRLVAELVSISSEELTADEKAIVEKRLTDLGYL
jgi:hypothetical protein